MLTYFLIWFALGLYGVIYLTLLEYRSGVEVDISVYSVLACTFLAAVLGGGIAFYTLKFTFGWLHDIFGKTLFTFQRNKK